jgi:hypothetical protein
MNQQLKESKYSVTYLATGGKGTQGMKRPIHLTKTFLSREKMQAWIDAAENDKIEGFIDFISISENTDLKESFRPGYGMVPAPINDKTYKAKGLRKLWGIAMRAGKWADTFIGLYSDGSFSIIDTNDNTETKYANGPDVLAALKKLVNEGIELLGDSLNEVLSKNATASDWIHDFVKSDAPQFKGKSKKERIKMALGAYYASQQKESFSSIPQDEYFSNLEEAINTGSFSKAKELLREYSK